MADRSLEIAAHEAAHVVVGVALGLRLRAAKIAPADMPTWSGYAWFPRAKGVRWALVLAAGVVWEEAHGGVSDGDLEMLRALGYKQVDIAALGIAAGAILAKRHKAHADVTRALLERDLTEIDIAAIARGERISDSPE